MKMMKVMKVMIKMVMDSSFEYICEPPPVSDDSFCLCRICKIGRMNGSEWAAYTKKANRRQDKRRTNLRKTIAPSDGDDGALEVEADTIEV